MRIAAFSLMCVSVVASAQTPPLRSVKMLVNIGDKPGSRDEVLAGITSIGLAKGNLYVLEGRGCVVKAFDAKGKFIRRFGSEGNGPGQCTRPSLLVMTDSTVTIAEFIPPKPRSVVFSLDGKPLRVEGAPAINPQADRILRGGTRFSLGRIAVNASSANSPLGDGPPPQNFVLLQAPGATGPDTLAKIRVDYGYVARPDTSGPGFTFFGTSGAFVMSGDSLIAIVDGYEGVAKWYAVGDKGAELKRTENLGRKGAPITQADIDARAEQMAKTLRRPTARGTPPQPYPPGSIKIFHAPERWSVATNAFFSSDGALWVSDRLARPVTDPNMRAPDNYQYIVYPASGAPYTIELPSTFALISVVGDKIYGYSLLGTGTVPIYQISPP